MTRKRYRKLLRALMTTVWNENNLKEVNPTGNMLKAVRDSKWYNPEGYAACWAAMEKAFPREVGMMNVKGRGAQ